jgi:hypothetical protein
MVPWIYDEKFLMSMRFMFGTLTFTMEEDTDLEHMPQDQEERHMMTIDFEFPQDLKSSVTTFQAVARLPAISNSINSMS